VRIPTPGLIEALRTIVPLPVRGLVWRVRRAVRPFPHIVRLTDLVPAGCRFEVTCPAERDRVTSLGTEETFLRLFLAEVQQGDVVYDVGACVGLFALHSALSGATVVAFEPDPSFRARLLRNVRLNRLASSVSVVPWAVADTIGSTTLFTDGIDGASPSLREVGTRSAVSVETDSLDNAVDKGLLPAPDLVKLDIEGAEILALRGMTGLLASPQAPRCVFIELHPLYLPTFGSSLDECVALLASFGYAPEWSRERAQQVHIVFRRVPPAGEGPARRG